MSTFASAAHENSLPNDFALQNRLSGSNPDDDRVRSALALFTSNSTSQLEELMSSLQEVRQFLNLEAERVQREIADYVQLQQSVAAAATKILSDTIGRKSATAEGVRPLSGAREKLKRWPSG